MKNHLFEIILLVALLFGVVACASTYRTTHALVPEYRDSLMGLNRQQLLTKLNSPTRIVPDNNGGTIWCYEQIVSQNDWDNYIVLICQNAIFNQKQNGEVDHVYYNSKNAEQQYQNKAVNVLPYSLLKYIYLYIGADGKVYRVESNHLYTNNLNLYMNCNEDPNALWPLTPLMPNTLIEIVPSGK